MLPRLILGLVWLFVAIGCSSPVQLAQAPNVLLPVAQYPDEGLPDVLRTVQPNIYFVTDREQSDTPTAEVGYTHERSASMLLGRQTLQFGEGIDWEELKLLSVLRRSAKVPVRAHTTRHS